MVGDGTRQAWSWGFGGGAPDDAAVQMFGPWVLKAARRVDATTEAEIPTPQATGDADGSRHPLVHLTFSHRLASESPEPRAMIEGP
jgi:hypothetical protein